MAIVIEPMPAATVVERPSGGADRDRSCAISGAELEDQPADLRGLDRRCR